MEEKPEQKLLKPDPANLLEERRYFINKLGQAIAIYFAFTGFAFKIINETTSLSLSLFLGIILTLGQFAAWNLAKKGISIVNSIQISLEKYEKFSDYNKLILNGLKTLYVLIILVEFVIIFIVTQKIVER